MRSATLSDPGNDTRAVSVARLTVAATPSSLFSFFSTRVAHDAQVIPPMTRSVVLMIGSHEGQRAAGSRADGHGADAVQALDLLSDGAGAMLASHAGYLIRHRCHHVLLSPLSAPGNGTAATTSRGG